MPYRYATEPTGGADLASGLVLYSAPGYPAFPARLAVEVFARAHAYLRDAGPVSVWDPCCGSGQLATLIGWLRRPSLRRVTCSDVDPEAVALARRNLELLSPDGLGDRERHRREQATRLAKPAYQEAADAARRLAGRLAGAGGALPWTARCADVFDPAALAPLVATARPDLVVTDTPYGEQTGWGGAVPEQPVPAMLRSLASVLPPHAVIAVVARTRKIPTAATRPLERLKIGTRAAVLVRAGEVA